MSESTVCRLLRQHGFTRKKVRMIALQRSEYLRAMFMAEVPSCCTGVISLFGLMNQDVMHEITGESLVIH